MEIRKQYLTKDGIQNKSTITPEILGRFSANELQFAGMGRRVYDVEKGSYVVNMQSSRYKVFKQNPTCTACGAKGNILLLERHRYAFRKKLALPKAHFELYFERNGLLTLMTKDHIIPKSKGGTDGLANLQTMCMDCNSFKRNYSISLSQIARREMESMVCPMCGTTVIDRCSKCYSETGERIQEAIDCANKLHKGIYRKGIPIPYIVHPIEVMKLLAEWGIKDRNALCAAILHDGVEDGFKGKGEVPSEEARRQAVRKLIVSSCNKEVLDYVEELTYYEEQQSKSDYLHSWLDGKSVISLLEKLADRYKNVKDFLISDAPYAKKYFYKATPLFNAFKNRREEIIKEVGQSVHDNVLFDLRSLENAVGNDQGIFSPKKL